MVNSVDQRIAAALDAVPAILRPAVTSWLERLREQHDPAELPERVIEPLCRVVACSEFAGAVVLRQWSWLIDNAESMDDASAAEVLADVVDDDAEIDVVKAQLRRARNRAMLRIIWREVAGLADLDETLGELSRLADAMLETATARAERLLEARYGCVVDASGERVSPVILGMGKLGGGELNFSSDIDLIFLFTDDGMTNGAKQISAQEYFGRLSRHIIALIDEVTVDGFVFRIDTRLRPFGDSGPPVVSFAALEAYLLQHGRDWERYAYVKARIAGAQPAAAVIDDLDNNLIRPFVYRRYIDYGVFESLRSMHTMIAAEVQRRELKNNIKLGPGGIREAEFVVQSLQLVRGGSEPALQGRELQKVLPKLVGSRGLGEQAAERLQGAYRFLRRVENFIQMMRDQQTHELPTDAVDQARLCFAMGYPNWEAFAVELTVSIVTRLLLCSIEWPFVRRRRTRPCNSRLRPHGKRAPVSSSGCNFSADKGCTDADAVARRVVAFASAPATRQIDSVAAARLQRFMPELLAEVIEAGNPDVALARTLTVIEKILRRSAYLALLNENRPALTRLVDLCARSGYIAEQIARHPVLLDELLDPRIFSGEVTKAELQTELQQRLRIDAADDSEAKVQIISQFQRAAMFRIAVADFNGSLPIMKVSDGLTWLAEAVLEAVLQVAWQDLVARHGKPTCIVDDVSRDAGFGIIAYGKLGGLELSYGSDLDIVFLHDSGGRGQVTDGEKALDNSMFYGRLVRRLVHFLTTQTGSGAMYEVDMRLRPDGQKGLLVTSTDAFERYQEDNAWTWEHQALLRARAVAGSTTIADEFLRIRRDTLIDRVKRDSLRDDVMSMRQRMRKELDKSNESRFDLKHGAGGIGDIEFLVQYLVLLHARDHPDVIFYSDNIRQLDALAEAGCVDLSVAERLKDCYRSYRLRQHHLVLDDQLPLLEVDHFAEERRFVVQTWGQWLD